MKELNEKDLEQAAGGYISSNYRHLRSDCCDQFEPDFDATTYGEILSEETLAMLRCCSHCIHGEKSGTYIGCLKNVPGSRGF